MEPLWHSEDPILRPLEDWQLNLAIIVAILVSTVISPCAGADVNGAPGFSRLGVRRFVFHHASTQ
jgi:hypothetical protein